MDDRDFEISIQSASDPDTSHLLDLIKQWLLNETAVENSFVLYKALGIFGSENLDDSHQYYPRESNGSSLLITNHDGIKFADEGFCEIIGHQFRYTGTFSLRPGQVLISKSLAQKVELIIQRPLTVGSKLSFAYGLRSEPLEVPKYLRDLQRTFIFNVTVAGIFQRIPKPDLSQLKFNPETLTDDVCILPRSLLSYSRETSLERNYMTPSLFVRLNRDYLNSKTFEEVEEEIIGLKSRIAHEFPQVIAKIHMSDIQEAKEQFEDSRTIMLFLLIPIVLLAACFTYFAVEIVVRGRIREMAVLRVRGAQTYQLFTSFLLEFMAITLLGLIIGVVLGKLLAALVPAATGFILFDFANVGKNYQDSPIPSIAWVSASIFCIAMALIPLLLQIRRFFLIDISVALGRPEVRRRTSRVGSLLMPERLRVFLPLIAGLLATFVTFIFLIETGFLTRYYGASRWRVVLFILTLGFWVAFTATTARVLSGVLPTIKPFLRAFIGKPAFLAARSLQRRQTQMLSLIIILTMTFSVGVFSMVNGETLGENTEKQLRYLVGSDFKIRTNPLEIPSELFLTQEPGIKKILPIFYSHGLFGEYVVSIVGVDPLSYSEMAVWDSTSFQGPRSDYEHVLSALATTPNGIILNSFMAKLMGVSLSDTVTLFEIGGDLGVNSRFEVVGIARSLPGFGSTEEPLGDVSVAGKNGGIVVIRSDSFRNIMSLIKTGLFLAQARENSNQKEVAERLRDNPNVLQVFAAVEVEELEEDLSKVSPLGIISVGFIVSAGVGILSLTIFLSYIISERKDEYALMLSCGAKRRQVIKLILGEFAGVVSFSFIIGSLMGIAFSWIYLKIAGSVISVSVLPINQVIPIITLLQACFIITVVMLIATFFPARTASRCHVGMALRSNFV
ncbi:MAG: ABC transporter permease [Candidatus Hodarchaeota archaeon]